MDDRGLEAALLRLSASASAARGAGPDFSDRVWERVGEFNAARERRRHTFLGMAIFAVALGTGGMTQASVAAQPASQGLADTVELAPSTLLHVAP